MNAARRPTLTAAAIIDDAIALIRERGVGALSMRALATRLGVTAPALYAHFAGREELLRGCAQVGYDALDERFQKEAPDTPIEMIWVSSRSYVHFSIDEPELFLLMFMFRPDAIEIDAEADIEHGGATTVFNSMIHNLRLAIESGQLKPADPLDYGLALWAAVHGVATVATLAPGLAVDPLLDTVVGGLIAGWSV